MEVGGIIYVDDTKVRGTASMMENITRVRTVLGQMLQHPEKDKLQFNGSKIGGFFCFIGSRNELHNTM